MKTVAAAIVLLSFAFPACAAVRSHVSPPTWTILRQARWTDNEGGPHRAIAVFGPFRTKEECVAKNGGKMQTEGQMPDGRIIIQSCEMNLEGAF